MKVKHLAVPIVFTNTAAREGAVRMRRHCFAMVMITMAIAASLVPGFTHAECRGLNPPPPQTLNICETLVEDLLVPGGTRIFCDVPWCAPPHCHTPGACHVDPICKSFEKMEELAGTLLYAGDLYCDPREVEPEELVEKLAMDLLADTTALTTGGVSSILFKVANAQIDFVECQATPLAPALKDVVSNIVANAKRPRDEYFYPVDVEDVRIVAKSKAALGSLYLREGYGGITLGNVVILEDDLFEPLKRWDHPWGEARFGQLTDAEEAALGTLIHELVHVHQYRDMGKEPFINRYLIEALRSGYASINMETEAYEFQSWANHKYQQLVAASLAIVGAVLH